MSGRKAALVLAASLLAACSSEAPPTEAPETSPSTQPTAPATAADGPTFRYTRLEGCTLTRSAPEEAGFFEHECPGEGGYRLRHVEADLRENLVVLAPGGGEHNLDLTGISQGAFSSLGERVEWRGVEEAGAFTPHALIVRQSVMENPDPAVPEVSYLVVAALGPGACVLTRIAPSPHQNDRARAAADQGGPCPAGPAAAGAASR